MVYQGYQLIRVLAADGVCRATIDNPPINLLDVALLSEIDRLAREVAADDDVRVLIVDSADPEIFIAHADVGLILDLPADDVAPHDELTPFHSTMELFRTLPKATIAAEVGATAHCWTFISAGTPGMVCGRRLLETISKMPALARSA